MLQYIPMPTDEARAYRSGAHDAYGRAPDPSDI